MTCVIVSRVRGGGTSSCIISSRSTMASCVTSCMTGIVISGPRSRCAS